MPAYYNEFEPYAADWLERLIAVGLLPDGDVDRRSILDVRPDDLKGYDQCHFFAGIGGWGLALRLVGWPDDRPVWTGSCPCQPFSVAGQRKGSADERHLWPVWYELIKACRPEVVFGEQVASTEIVGSRLEADFALAVRRGEYARANSLAKRLVRSPGFHFHRRWIDTVQADMAAEGYAVRFDVLGAHSVGAPHIRQRLWFVADAGRVDQPAGALERRRPVVAAEPRSAEHRGAGSVANRHDEGLEVGREQPSRREREAVERGGASDELADAMHTGRAEGRASAGHRQVAGGCWSDLEWLPCRDGKARPTQSGLFPLAHGIPGRVGRLRAYGNAIVPQVAAEFIAAYLDCRE